MDMNKTITISREDFIEASTSIMKKGALGELLKEKPMMVLMCTMISSELHKELFKEEV